MLKLRIAAGPASGTCYDITERSIIGRDTPATIIVPDAVVSRTHAEIVPGPDGWSVADLGSANGTSVDGRSSRAGMPIAVRSGSRIRIGHVLLVVDSGVPLPHVNGVRVTAHLGRGSIGNCFVAVDDSNQPMVLKIAHDLMIAHARLHNGVGRQIAHPHVVVAHAIDSGIAMPLFAKGNLDEALNEGPMSTELVMALAHRIAMALAALADARIHPFALHPGNLLRNEAGVWHIADALFSLPFTADDPRAPYAAPEVLEGQAADARSTMFSFGQILHRCLFATPCPAGTAPALDPQRHGDALTLLLPRLLAVELESRPETWADVLTVLSHSTMPQQSTTTDMIAVVAPATPTSLRPLGQSSRFRATAVAKPAPRLRVPDWAWIVVGLIVVGFIVAIATAPRT